MSDFEKSKPRDPGLEKTRDLARQRKIASNSSDKASRKNAPRIKAMANRTIRHTDKIRLRNPELIEESADQINLEHNRKWQNWGSNNAAEMRATHAETQAYFRENGGRKAVQRNGLIKSLKTATNPTLRNYYEEQLRYLDAPPEQCPECKLKAKAKR